MARRTVSSIVPAHAGRHVQAGDAAEDRADVDRLAGARRAPRPAVAPARERADDGQQVTGALGQLVVHARRHLAVALAGEQAVGDHAVQARAQLLGRDAGQHALQLDEPAGPGGKVADDQERPLVADEIERACVRSPLVVGVPLGRGNGGHRWWSLFCFCVGLAAKAPQPGKEVTRLTRFRGTFAAKWTTVAPAFRIATDLKFTAHVSSRRCVGVLRQYAMGRPATTTSHGRGPRWETSSRWTSAAARGLPWRSAGLRA